MRHPGIIEIAFFNWREPYAVIHWDEHRDSGQTVGAFPRHQQAVDFARDYACDSDAHLHTAEVVCPEWGAQR
ncbi:hypothetical protein [uncultured Jannaschia sp.]|uniref:hypothetical protein n=1 Tax=uncultured Jannaschia sp. TaxID=293347 RepID=UPI00260DBE05|nr:hypothetical protein [uncultured Jannaschia sp.]